MSLSMRHTVLFISSCSVWIPRLPVFGVENEELTRWLFPATRDHLRCVVVHHTLATPRRALLVGRQALGVVVCGGRLDDSPDDVLLRVSDCQIVSVGFPSVLPVDVVRVDTGRRARCSANEI